MPHALPLKPGIHEKRAQQALPWIDLRRTDQASADLRHQGFERAQRFDEQRRRVSHVDRSALALVVDVAATVLESALDQPKNPRDVLEPRKTDRRGCRARRQKLALLHDGEAWHRRHSFARL